MGDIRVLRAYQTKNGDRRTLDPGFINTMAILVSQRTFEGIEQDIRDGWLVFHTDSRSIFRQLRPTRSLNHYGEEVCVVDRDFTRVLGVKDGDVVSLRPFGEKEALKFWVWMHSMTPTVRIAFCFTIISTLASAFLGALLGGLL